MELKKRLRELIMNNRIGESLRVLLEFTKKLGDEKLYNEVITQSSIFKQYKQDRRQKTDSDEALEIVIAKIRSSLLEIIDELPENTVERKNRIWLLVLSVSSLLTITVLVWLFKPKINPTPIENGKLVPDQTFHLIVQVHGEEGKDDIILENKGEVTLYLAGEREHAAINAFGEAYFENLPLEFKSKEIRIKLNAEGFIASQPNKKYSLQQETVYFPIKKRTNSINKVPTDRTKNNEKSETTKIADSSSKSIFNQGFEGNLVLVSIAKKGGVDESLESHLQKAQHITSNSFFLNSFLVDSGTKLWREGSIILGQQSLPPTLKCICLINEQKTSFQEVTKYGEAYTAARSSVSIKVLHIKSGETQSFSIPLGGAGADSMLAYQSLRDNFSIAISEKNYIKEFDICKE